MLMGQLNLLNEKPNGFSMVEALVGIAVLSVLATVVATVSVDMSTNRKAISQRQEILNFRNYVQNEFTSVQACSAMLSGAPVDLSGVSQTQASRTVIPIRDPATNRGVLKVSTDGFAEAAAIVGEKLKGSTTGLRVSDIVFKDITETGIQGEYLGYFEIQFDNSVGSVKPVRLRKTVRVDPATGTIAGCKGPVMQVEICRKTGKQYDPATDECVGGVSATTSPPGDFLVTHSGAASPWSAASTTCNVTGAYSTYHPSNEYSLIAMSCYMYMLDNRGRQTSTCNATLCMWRWNGPSSVAQGP